MKFVHIADLHFDSPFVNLADKEGLGETRRLEQRKIFKKVIEYIKDNNIKYLFISGDLYEHKYIKKTTIEYINNLFKEIPNTLIFISPGNHDPYLKNSYYNKFNWNENVKIFKNKIEKIETENANIYGFGFDDFYCTDCGIENLEIEEKNKINILVIHGTLNGASLEEKQYNSIKSKTLEEKGFDYVALGHIHKLDYNTYENQRIVYPGSTASLGFDELGQHGMIVGELDKEKIKLEFIPIDETEFEIQNLDITQINSKEELIETINELNIEENNLIEIYLTGKRNFEIDTYEIKKFITNEKIIKIKNKTKINYNLEKIAEENTLRGIFVKKMLDKYNLLESEEEKSILENSIEIGLESLI
ncbi:MAG: DNA repair exonuclease [Clostridia bacterium]|nr:DNA repair exonuclease [Clostridia bacterium]